MRFIVLLVLLLAQSSFGFCGFYVAKADASLYNQASQVILVHHDDKTALTLVNDFKGELAEFALVVPVPEVLTREQINVADRGLVERVDAYSAPRLVEYFDPDPCSPPIGIYADGMRAMKGAVMQATSVNEKSLGVTIEAQYTIGEYDIVILSAKESDGLEKWLIQSGYKIPKGASKALEPYLKQGLKFFVAKVNLKEQAKTGFTFLRPIQFAFESKKFMLPIRLGMINATGPQDLLVYAITKKGRVETTNYRTVKLPAGMDVPVYVKKKFPDFYRSLFEVSHEKENKKVVFQEYAWNMSWCDPCAAEPLTREELKKLGVFWLDDATEVGSSRPGGIRPQRIIMPPGGGAIEAYITRLHVRYDAERFPEDLMFQETADTENYQARFVLRHPWVGDLKCELGEGYRKELKSRRQKEAETLAMLTGWKMADIKSEMGPDVVVVPDDTKPKKWFQKIFK